MTISLRNSFGLISCVLAIAATLYLMAFGVAVLLGAAPSATTFWRPEKLFYGLLPICAGIVILLATLRRWTKHFDRRQNGWLTACAVVTLCVSLDAVVFHTIRSHWENQEDLRWNAAAGVFRWGSGEVRLPPGFTYTAEHGIDTQIGRFISADGKVVITHDIGELAGEHGGMGTQETQTEGSRVRIGRATGINAAGSHRYFFKVSFPDNGCANFSSESVATEDTAAIESIASTFRPIGRTPAFLRPLLPEILRSDCRYRISTTE